MSTDCPRRRDADADGAGRAARSLPVGGAAPDSAQERDRGSGTVWVLAIALVVLMCGVIGMFRGLAVIARHRAETAADFAALAAASSVLEGTSVACRRAATIAAANGAVLRQCRLDGADATVSTSVRVNAVVPGHFAASAEARAGPAGDR